MRFVWKATQLCKKIFKAFEAYMIPQIEEKKYFRGLAHDERRRAFYLSFLNIVRSSALGTEELALDHDLKLLKLPFNKISTGKDSGKWII